MYMTTLFINSKRGLLHCSMQQPITMFGRPRPSRPTKHGNGRTEVGRLGVRIGVRMFSMEDRRRAVDLYFTEGMTIRKVVAKLGYPSEGALAKWVREDPRCTVPLAFHKF